MKSFVLLSLLLTQVAFAESINDLSGTFNRTENTYKNPSKDDSKFTPNETFSFDESTNREPASEKKKPSHHITEITGTFDK